MEKHEKRHLDKHNLMVRTISGAVIAVLIILFSFLGGWYFFSLIGLLSLIGLFEFYRIFDIHKTAFSVIGYLSAVLQLVNAGCFRRPGAYSYPILTGTFILTMIVYVLTFEKTSADKALAAFFGPVYTVGMFSYMVFLRNTEHGLVLMLLVYLCSFGCDIFAYFVGSLFGKHKMAPVLSPKKSVEGAVGGVIGSMFLGLVYALCAQRWMNGIAHPILLSMGIAGLSAILSMFGDLTASAFKRNTGVKDYSHLIPGHGGVLDRFDSLMLITPIVYYIVSYFVY